MEARHLTAIERWTMILAGIVIAAATIAAPRKFAFGVALGAALMVANAYAVRRVGQRLLRSVARPGAAVLLLNLKMLLLIAVVFVIVRYLPVDAIGFLIGISVFPLAAVIAAVRVGLSETPETAETPSHGES